MSVSTRTKPKTSIKRKASDTPIIEPILQKTKLTTDEVSDPGSPITINLTKRFNRMTVQSAQKLSTTSKSDFPSEPTSPIAKRGRGRPKGSGNKKKSVTADKEITDSGQKESPQETQEKRATRSRTGAKGTNNWSYREEDADNDDKEADDDFDVSNYEKVKSLSAMRSKSQGLLGSDTKSSKTRSAQKADPKKIEVRSRSTTPRKLDFDEKKEKVKTPKSAKGKKETRGRKPRTSLKKIEERSDSEEEKDDEGIEIESEDDDIAVNGGISKKAMMSKLDFTLGKFDKAILNLQEYTLPDEIPCRETEKKFIKDLLMEGLESEGFTHCLYISGVPGIGKTVSVLEVIKQLKQECEKTNLDFNFIHVNGLNLPNPENAYQTILRGIVNINEITNSSACVILNNLFQKGTLPKAFKQHKTELDTRTRVVLLDELDYLITKDQNLLYNLFDWPHYKQSKLIIIGIANTMNLPEQLLPKITSRMGNRRLVYKPYTSHQIEKILLSRIEKMDIIRPEAITFLSKKIATFSSDIRRTLHVCRESLKICREEYMKKYQQDAASVGDKGLLGIDHVRKSYDSIYSSPYHQCISTLMENSRLLLLAICLEMKIKGEGYANMNEVQERLKGMLNNLGRKTLHHTETKQIFSQLVSLGLVLGKQKALLKKESQTSSGRAVNIMDIQITLKVSLDDITNAMKDDGLVTKYVDLL